jgi:hypothetical protein
MESYYTNCLLLYSPTTFLLKSTLALDLFINSSLACFKLRGHVLGSGELCRLITVDRWLHAHKVLAHLPTRTRAGLLFFFPQLTMTLSTLEHTR